MDYYAYGNTEVIKRIFSTIVMMTGGNSSFDSLMAAIILLVFTIMLGKTAFELNFSPLAKWFLGSIFVWYVMVMPKVTVTISDQTNPTNITAISNVPLGPAFVGYLTSSIGKWFVDKAEIVFTPINDINYSRSGMVFGANAYSEMRRADIARFVPQIQTDFSQYLANCTTYDIRLYNKFTQENILNSDDIWSLIKNTNSVLPTPVWNRNSNQIETKFCNEAAILMEQNITAALGNPKLLQAFAVRLDPAGNRGATTDQTRVMNALEAAYSNIFEGIRKPALKIIQQEMMVNAVKVADIQNAAIDGSPEQMQAALAAAQAQAQVHTQNTSAWIMASKYLPIAHNVIEAVLLALAPLVIVMMIMGGMSMGHVALGYVATVMWVKLWPGMFAVVNGIANMYQANHTYGAAYGARGTTLANSMDVLSVASDTQAFAGSLTMLVPLISWGLIKLGSMGLQAAFSGVSAPGGRATESSSASVGAGNINVGNSSYDNANAHKNDRSSWFKDPGVNQTSTYAGTKVSGAMGGSYFKGDLPVTATSSLAQSQEYSRMAAQSQEAGRREEASATQSYSAATSSAFEYMMSKGDDYAKKIGASSSISADSRRALQYAESAAQDIMNKTGVSNSLTAKSALAATISAGLGDLGLPLKLGGSAGVSQEQAQQLQTAADNAIKAGRSQGYKIDKTVAESVRNSEEYAHDQSQGNSLTQRIGSNLSSAESASKNASVYRSEADSLSQKATESWKEGIQISGNIPVNDSTVQGIESADLTKPSNILGAQSATSRTMGVSAPPTNYSEMSSGIQSSIGSQRSNIDDFFAKATGSVNHMSQSGQNRVQNSAGKLGQESGLPGEFQQKRNSNSQAISGQGSAINTGRSHIGDAQNQVIERGAKISELSPGNQIFSGNLWQHDNKAAFGDAGNIGGSGITNGGLDAPQFGWEGQGDPQRQGVINNLPKVQPDRTQDPARTPDTMVIDSSQKPALRKLTRRK